MNLNCDTFMKQEFLNAEERLVNSLPGMDLHIPIKNEPISDDCLPLATIKNEPPTEVGYVEGSLTIKRENPLQDQQTTFLTEDRFMIYELETPPGTHMLSSLSQQTRVDRTLNAATFSKTPMEIPDTFPFQQDLVNKNRRPVINFDQSKLRNGDTHRAAPNIVPVSRPVLLNAQLRKRRKVVLTANPIDKRTRYNIKGAPLEKNSIPVSSTNSSETSNEGRLLNTGIKKIINYIIKGRRNQMKNDDMGKSLTHLQNTDTKDTENTFVAMSRNQDLNPLSTNISEITNTQTGLDFVKTPSPISSAAPPVTEISSYQQKHPVDPPIVSELRVKCLCSLTDHNTTGNAELRPFFNEMLEETRRLGKKQQRVIKMSLLKAISEAEELMELGKCCKFL